MSYPMFPENEKIVIDDNIFIFKNRVWFVVGVQYFAISEVWDNEEEARMCAQMFQTALNKIRK